MILPVIFTTIILFLLALAIHSAIDIIIDIISIRQVNNKPQKRYITYDERLEITKYFNKKLPDYITSDDVLLYASSPYHLYFFNNDISIKVQKYDHFSDKKLKDNYGCKFKDYTGFVFSIWKDSEDRLMTFRDKEILCEYINLGKLDLQLKQLLIDNRLKNIEQDFK